MEENKLKRQLNFFSLSVFGIGMIVGAGVYSVVGVAYGHAGTSLWLSFLLSALAAICTAFSYCELATMFPYTGAEYVYLREAFPKYLSSSFIVAIIILVAGFTTAATVAMSFAGYLQYFFSFPIIYAALLLIVITSLINIYGIQSSNYFNLLLTFIEVSGILLVIWFGLKMEKPVQHPEFFLNKGTLTATSLIFFVYLGFEEIANLAEETKNPEKNVPRAILASLLFTTVLYFAVSFSIIYLAEAKSIANSKFPLAQALATVAPNMEAVLCGIALFSTANTVLITLLVGSRMLYSLSRGGDLPKFLGKTHKDYSSPHVASVVMLIFSCLFLFAGDFEILVSLSSLATLLAFGAVNVAAIRLRYSKPQVKRPFVVPLSLGKLPLIPAIGILIIFFLCLQFTFKVYLYCLIMAVLCFVYYLFLKKFKNKLADHGR